MKRLQKGEIIFLLILAVTCVSLVFVSCTENQRARGWGGEMTINLEKGEKLVNVTWKESDMWILTRPMRAGETNEVYIFKEKSTFGVMEGEITIIESGGLKPTSYVEPKPIEWFGEIQTFKIN